MSESICQVCNRSTVTWGCQHGRWCADHLEPHLAASVGCRDQFMAGMPDVMQRFTEAFRAAFRATYTDEAEK